MQFVILRHETADGVHFDFMLEAEGALKTWSLPEPPRADEGIECRQLPDHRLAYLDYEGPVSGGRGAVTRWDRGTYETQRQSDREWIVCLSGERLSGGVTLRRTAEGSDRWRLLLADYRCRVAPEI